MATPYSVLFDSFLSKIEDPVFQEMGIGAAESDMIKLLNSAIIHFHYPKVNVYNKSDLMMTFNEDLGVFEIEILALLMNVEWINRQIKSIYNIRQTMNDKDFRRTSQANHLLALMKLKEQAKLDVESVKKKYSYKDININKPDFSGLAGD